LAIGRTSNDVLKMTITANGNKQYLKAVEELVKHAPKLEGREFKALKQPVEKDFMSKKKTKGQAIDLQYTYPFHGGERGNCINIYLSMLKTRFACVFRC
jgi:hypothetical protein